MLYLVGLTHSETNWTGMLMQSLRSEFFRLNIEYQELPPYDWGGAAAPLRDYLRIPAARHDTWLIAWAHSPLIEYIKSKPGRKFGFVSGVMAGHFDPLSRHMSGGSGTEYRRLQLYDGLLAVSHWCSHCLVRAYPQLAAGITVTGFPLDMDFYRMSQAPRKESGLVVFNQRFAHERLPALELEVSALLAAKGCRVLHLTGSSPEQIARHTPSLAPLIAQADSCGLSFLTCPTKEMYLQQLSKAETVITTSAADTLSVATIEAILLGAVPVAPQAFCFPEYIHSDNLYTPYDLREITDLAQTHPQRPHRIMQYSKERVVPRMLQAMGIL